MYFDIGDSIARTGDYSATFTISYFDSGTGADPGPVRQRAVRPVPRGRNDHPDEFAHLEDRHRRDDRAYFGGLENVNGDFRLHSATNITVHSVAVSVTGPAVVAATEFPPARLSPHRRTARRRKLGSSISGTSEPDGSVTVREEGTALCTATAADDGTWSCAPANGSRREHSITATVTDPTGSPDQPRRPSAFVASDQPPGTAVVGTVVGAANSSYGLSQDETRRLDSTVRPRPP